MTQITLDIGTCSEDNRTGDVTWTDGVERIGNAEILPWETPFVWSSE